METKYVPVFPPPSITLSQETLRGHGGSVVTHLPPISEVSSLNPGPYVGKLVVACRWSAVYSTEP